MNIKKSINSLLGRKQYTGIIKTKSLFDDNSEWTDSSWGKQKEINTYKTSLYIYSCVKKRAQKVAQLLNFKLKSYNGNKEYENHNILDVLNKPNPYQDKNEFFELYQTYKDLTGSVFIYVIRAGEGMNSKISELHLLRPDLMKIVINKEKTAISHFETTDVNASKKIFSPEEIVFSLAPNPFGSLEALSPLKPGGLSIDTVDQLMKYQYNILKNGGKIEGVFTFDTDYLGKEDIDDMKEQYEEKYAEAKRSGKPLFLGGKAKYDKLSLTPTELAYLESKKMARDDILLLYQVPKTILGLTDGVQKGNYEEANRMFIKDTIAPEIKNLVNKLNQFLVPDDLELYCENPVPEDVDLKLKEIESGSTHHYLTINEMRELANREPLKNGDKIFIPMALVEQTEEPENKK